MRTASGTIPDYPSKRALNASIRRLKANYGVSNADSRRIAEIVLGPFTPVKTAEWREAIEHFMGPGFFVNDDGAYAFINGGAVEELGDDPFATEEDYDFLATFVIGEDAEYSLGYVAVQEGGGYVDPHSDGMAPNPMARELEPNELEMLENSTTTQQALDVCWAILSEFPGVIEELEAWKQRESEYFSEDVQDSLALDDEHIKRIKKTLRKYLMQVDAEGQAAGFVGRGNVIASASYTDMYRIRFKPSGETQEFDNFDDMITAMTRVAPLEDWYDISTGWDRKNRLTPDEQQQTDPRLQATQNLLASDAPEEIKQALTPEDGLGNIELVDPTTGQARARASLLWGEFFLNAAGRESQRFGTEVSSFLSALEEVAPLEDWSPAT